MSLGISKVGITSFRYSAKSDINNYPFKNFRVTDKIRSFLGLHFNPETRDFNSRDTQNAVHR